MHQSEQINELISALSKAQGEIVPAIKDSSNPFFKSKYADLSSVWNACKDPLSKNGLAVVQATDYKDGQLLLLTTLAHSSGQWMRSCMPVITQDNKAQSIGSAITYMRRYALSAIVGVTCDEDDDGNEASGRKSFPNASTTSEKISKDQAQELSRLLDMCDTDFKQNALNWVKSSANVDKLENLSINTYDILKKRIIKKMQEGEANARAS